MAYLFGHRSTQLKYQVVYDDIWGNFDFHPLHFRQGRSKVAPLIHHHGQVRVQPERESHDHAATCRTRSRALLLLALGTG